MLLIAAVLIIAAAIYKIYQNSKQNYPPGPWGLPILGYIPFLDRKKTYVTFTKLAHKYGPIYSIKMGSIFTVVLNDYKLVREALAKDLCSGRAPLYLINEILQGKGIIFAEDALWRDQRRLATNSLKHLGMSKHGMNRKVLTARISNGMEEVIQILQERKGEQVDLKYIITDALGNIVNDFVFGVKFPSGDPIWEWMKTMQEEACQELGGAVNFFPIVKFFSNSIKKTVDAFLIGQRQSHRIYASIVASRRKLLNLEPPKGCEYPGFTNLEELFPGGITDCKIVSAKEKDGHTYKFHPERMISCKEDSILDYFLHEQKKRFDEGDVGARFMSDEQMLFFLADMFGAGLDTTSTTLAWLFMFLAIHQDLQEWTREEILKHYPTESSLIDLDYLNLPRITAAFFETQRIRTVIPCGIPHGTLEDMQLGGFFIPKGTMIMTNQYCIHMNPETWPDPETFKPDRFLADDGSVLKPQEFIPFQTGKRMCVGDELARMLGITIAVRVLQKYRFTIDDKLTAEDLEGTMGFSLTPRNFNYRCEPI